MKMYQFLLKFHWSLFTQGSNQQYSSIGSDNGLAPTRRQAIIWANVEYFPDAYVRNSASMSWYVELSHCICWQFQIIF